MECEEIRVDIRIPNPEGSKEAIRASQVMFKLNHTMPFTDEYNSLLKELFGDNLGEDSFVAAPISGACVSSMKIGNHVFINSNLLAMARGGITIEDDVQIAANVQLISNNHDAYDRQVLTCKPVLIKKGAWIGAGASILPGVCVGKHAIIGAASVVTKDVPDYAVAVGNPAKVIRMLDEDKFEEKSRMRGIKKFVPALVVFLLLTACAKTDVAEIEQTNAITSATKETEAADTEMVTDQNIGADGNILVAYFSRAGENYNVGVVEKGNTEIVAEMIAQETGADLFRIQPTYDYPETYEECTEAAKKEQEEKARPELSDTVDNISEYDVIYVGYPIWWGDMPMAVYTFLESYDFSGKTVIPFCTHAGSGLAGTADSIREICIGASVPDGLAIKGETAQNDPDAARTAVDKFLGNE